jgi:hypothetical protein
VRRGRALVAQDADQLLHRRLVVLHLPAEADPATLRACVVAIDYCLVPLVVIDQ